jgi:WD40 repeat protein/serine/threonine protein kinase
MMRRIVALKVLAPSLSRDSEALARFRREVIAAASLTHPNIVTAHDAQEIQGVAFLVMEYVPGVDLATWVRQHGPLSLDTALNCILQAARGLQYAHRQKVVHRDIKPHNLLYALLRDEDESPESAGQSGTQSVVPGPDVATKPSHSPQRGTVKILDMGLARLGHAEDTEASAALTSSGVIMGTADYIAPEQAMNTHTADARSDIYSLGCTLWFLLTGRPPYPGGTVMEKFVAHREGSIPSLSEALRSAEPSAGAAPQVDAIDAVFRRMVAKKPQDRFQSARELIDALEAVPGVKSPARPATERIAPSGLDVFLQSQLSAGATSSDSSSPRQDVGNGTTGRQTPLSRKSMQWVSAGCVVVLLVAGFTFAIARNGRKSRTEPSRSSASEGAATTDSVGRSRASATSEQSPRLWHGWPKDAPKPAIAPFDAARARQHQEEWAKYLNVPVEYTNSIGMKYRLIPPGEFLMGNTDEETRKALKTNEGTSDAKRSEFLRSETPQHRVVLTQPFFMSECEVTQGEFQHVMRKNPSHFTSEDDEAAHTDGKAEGNADRLPVEGLTWNDAVDFCVELSKSENLQSTYVRVGKTVESLDIGQGYRLPTEAEWEFACRGGTTTQFWIGDNGDALLLAGWVRRNSNRRTHVVRKLKANPFGLFDVHGNVGEWVEDQWHLDNYHQSADKDAIDPRSLGGSNAWRGIRGGAYWADSFLCQSARRHASATTGPVDWFGFRPLLSVDGVRQALKVQRPKIPESNSPSAASDPRASNDPQKRVAEIVLRRGGDRWKPGPAEVRSDGLIPRPSVFSNVPEWQLERVRIFPASIRSMSWHPNGQRLAVVLGRSKLLRIQESDHPSSFLAGHDGEINCVAWSPRGDLLATGGEDKAVRLWQADGTPGPVLEGHGAGVNTIGWSSDGERLASGGSYDKTVRIWNARGELQRVLKSDHNLEHISWSPNGEMLAVGARGSMIVRIWKTSDWSSAGEFEVPSAKVDGGKSVGGLCWSSDSRLLLAANHGIRVWDVHEERLVRDITKTGGNSWINWIGWQPQGSWVAAVTQDGYVLLIDPDAGKQIWTSPQYSTLLAAAWSPDGKSLLDGDSRKWLLQGASLALENSLQPVRPISLAYDPKGECLAIGYDQGKVTLQEVNGGRLHVVEGGVQETARDLAWSPNGSRCAIATHDRIRVLTRDGRAGPVIQGHGTAILSIAWDPEGQRLASAGGDQPVKLWTSDGTPGALLKGHEGAVNSVAWDPKGRWIASGGADATVRLWNPNGSPGPELQGHTSAVKGLSWSRDGEWLASASADRSVRLWKADGTAGPVLEGHSRAVSEVVWCPQGRWLASCDGQEIRIWDSEGAAGPVIPIPFGFRKLDWIPGTMRLVSLYFDGTLRMWDAVSGEQDQVTVLLPDFGALRFSAAGELLEGDPAVAEQEVVYLLGTGPGSLKVLKHSEFLRQIGAAAGK